MSKFKSIENKVIIMKGDLAWGIIYKDGPSTSYGWTSDVGQICTYDFYEKMKPEHVTYSGSDLIEELRQGTIVHIVKTVEIDFVVCN